MQTLVNLMYKLFLTTKVLFKPLQELGDLYELLSGESFPGQELFSTGHWKLFQDRVYLNVQPGTEYQVNWELTKTKISIFSAIFVLFRCLEITKILSIFITILATSYKQ